VAETTPDNEGWADDPRVLLRAEAASVPAGTVLLRQGRLRSEAYVLRDGHAKVEQHGRLLTRVGPGSIVGELSLLDGGRSTVTVTAITRVELAVVSRRVFCAALVDHPDLLLLVFRQVASRVRAGIPPHAWGAVTN
jgi:CRP-like cAMP-binding protein